jgi:fluoride exporter
MIPLFVALGGLVGAPTRFVVDRLVMQRRGGDFPLGTLLVNLSGSFVLGLVAGLALAGGVPGDVKALVGTGMCGAYTTFSTWSFETVRLVEKREWLSAGLNVAVSLVLGLAVGGAGMALGLLR